MNAPRGRISMQAILFLAWGGLLVFGVGRVFARTAVANAPKIKIVASQAPTSVSTTNVDDGWRWVNQPGALRPGRALVPAGACASYAPPAPPPEPVNQTLDFVADAAGQAIATFVDDSQIYLYIPKTPTTAGKYEFRLWVVDGKNYGQANNGQTDVTAELALDGFPSSDTPELRDLQPAGAYVGQAYLSEGTNTLAVRLRRAKTNEDISQIARFQITI